VQALCRARSTAARSAREPRLRSQYIFTRCIIQLSIKRQINVLGAATSAASSRAATPSSRLMTLSSAPVPCIVLQAAFLAVSTALKAEVEELMSVLGTPLRASLPPQEGRPPGRSSSSRFGNE